MITHAVSIKPKYQFMIGITLMMQLMIDRMQRIAIKLRYKFLSVTNRISKLIDKLTTMPLRALAGSRSFMCVIGNRYEASTNPLMSSLS